MALRDYTPQKREFNLKGGSFAVQGLSLELVATLVRTRLDDLEHLWHMTEGIIGGKQSVDEGDLKQVAMILVEQLPELTASTIALAEGDSSAEAIEAARHLPGPVQIEVLFAIAELTFEEVGGIKKFGSRMKEILGKTSLPNKGKKQHQR